MQVRSRKNETDLVGAIRAGCKGVTTRFLGVARP